MINRRNINVILGIYLLSLGTFVLAQEDDSNLEDFDIDSENLTLESDRSTKDSSVKADAGPPVDDFSAEGSDENVKLELGNENLDANVKANSVAPVTLPSTTPPLEAVEPAPTTAAPTLPPTQVATPQSTADYDAPREQVAGENPASLPPAEANASLPFIPENEFAGTPYVPGGRKQMALGEAPDYYKIEPGDTLFDICDQLIDDADYWPKLWALNPGIKNPHFIFPGMVLSFYPGDDTTPPYLQVVTEEDIIPLETGGLTEQDLIAEEINEIPFDQPVSEITNVVFDHRVIGSYTISSEFEDLGQVYSPELASVEIPAFISDDSIDAKAEALGGPKGEIHVIEGDELLIDDDDGNLQLGSLYTVLRPNHSSLASDADSSYRYEFIGHIKALGSLDDGDIKVAKVLKSRLGIMPGDIISEYRSTKRSFSTVQDRTAADDSNSLVIGFDLPMQTLGGQGDLIFVEGQHSPGSVYNIYQNTEDRLPKLLRTEIPEMISRIGTVKIIDSVGSASLAVILRNEIDIRLNDRLANK